MAIEVLEEAARRPGNCSRSSWMPLVRASARGHRPDVLLLPRPEIPARTTVSLIAPC